MKLYAFATPSHRHLVEDHFLPSLPTSIEHHVKWVSQFQNKMCDESSGRYDEDGFNQTVKKKIEHIILIIQDSMHMRPFIYSDVDVRFYHGANLIKSVKHGLVDQDIVFQHDGPGGMCTGFMVIKPNTYTLALFKRVLSLMNERADLEDQKAMNMILASAKEEFGLRWGVLPTALFWTHGSEKGTIWEPDMPLNPPLALVMHHANWALGVPHKRALLEAVRAKIQI